MHFKDKDNTFEKNFTTVNQFLPSEQVTLLMNFSHNIKETQNNIYANGDHEIYKMKLKIK